MSAFPPNAFSEYATESQVALRKRHAMRISEKQAAARLRNSPRRGKFSRQACCPALLAFEGGLRVVGHRANNRLKLYQTAVAGRGVTANFATPPPPQHLHPRWSAIQNPATAFAIPTSSGAKKELFRSRVHTYMCTWRVQRAVHLKSRSPITALNVLMHFSANDDNIRTNTYTNKHAYK